MFSAYIMVTRSCPPRHGHRSSLRYLRKMNLKPLQPKNVQFVLYHTSIRTVSALVDDTNTVKIISAVFVTNDRKCLKTLRSSRRV